MEAASDGGVQTRTPEETQREAQLPQRKDSSDQRAKSALFETSIAIFGEAEVQLVYDESWDHLLSRQDALAASHRVLEVVMVYAAWWLLRARTLALSVNKDTGVYSGFPEEAEEAFTRAMALYEEARALTVCTPGTTDHKRLAVQDSLLCLCQQIGR